MQTLFLLITTTILDTLHSSHINHDDAKFHRKKRSLYEDYEPVTMTYSRSLNNTAKNINCDDFSSYAVKCRLDSALFYNSTKRTPPSPSKIYYWCKALRHLTNCAMDWNNDCKDVTDSHFNEESIKGHTHVINNICDDEWLLIRYADSEGCIDGTADAWENCYFTFKRTIEQQKNITQDWTHYIVHFNLCCARASFRRCTLGFLFEPNSHCTHNQAVTLQKYSVIVSEGDVYQDCERNMMYESCPGGDPRPSATMLARLMNDKSGAETWHCCCLWIPNLLLLLTLYN